MQLGCSHQDLGGVSRVDGDAVDHNFQSPWFDVVRFGDSFVVCVANVGLHHRHAVHGQCSRLIRADGGSVTHRLAGVQVTHQVVVLHHFLQYGKQGEGLRI